MLEEILKFISSVDHTWLYFILFFFSFIENVFPPSPSDVVLVVGATLISSTPLGFMPLLFITSFGSSLGFLVMYYVGKLFGKKVLYSGKIKFITKEGMDKTDAWFEKYGFKLILANRFLPGTRSIISFFSGVYELNLLKTFVTATISAFLWNFIIIYLGMKVGDNIQIIDYYLSTYSKIITIATIIVVTIFGIRYFLKKRGRN